MFRRFTMAGTPIAPCFVRCCRVVLCGDSCFSLRAAFETQSKGDGVGEVARMTGAACRRHRAISEEWNEIRRLNWGGVTFRPPAAAPAVEDIPDPLDGNA
jgi:hypothetical protein